jgi:hypothetical protein
MSIELFERFVSFAANSAGLTLFVIAAVGWLRTRANKPAPVDIAQGAPGVRDQDRVVLRFDPGKADVPGTFEHTIEQFKRRVDPETQLTLLVTPNSFEANQRWQHKGNFNLALLTAAGGVLMLAALPVLIGFLLSDPGVASSFSDEPWTSAMRVAIYPVCLLFFGGTALSAWERSQRSRRNAETARAYSAYLDQRAISMGYEFTQARAAHEWGQGTQIDAQ